MFIQYINDTCEIPHIVHAFVNHNQYLLHDIYNKTISLSSSEDAITNYIL